MRPKYARILKQLFQLCPRMRLNVGHSLSFPDTDRQTAWQDLIAAAAAAVKQSNWVIGEAASKWTERYAAGRTDGDFAELIGSSQPTVNQCRKVWERFNCRGNKHDFAWRHWRTMLTWDDADTCLDWAENTEATFAEMNAWRYVQRGELAAPQT